MTAHWNASAILDAYFLETRAKLLEIAATLDRLDRAADAEGVRGDPRMTFIGEALGILSSASRNRVGQIQRLYSKD